MAHIWREGSGSWDARKLGGDGLVLDAPLPARTVEVLSGAASLQPARLVQAGAAGTQAWALVAPIGSPIRVNGRSLPAGLRVLDDRDEIRAGNLRFFFSAESVAEVVAFAGAARPVFCGRCRLLIPAGDPAVCCPGCAIWHHQGGPDKRLCWTYAETCSYCETRTALDAGLKWIPEEE